MSRRRYRIVMVLENGGYPGDTRVCLEATALVQAGYDVSVICPGDKKNGNRWDVVDGVRVYRYPAPRDTGGVVGYVWEYGYSLIVAGAISLSVWLRHGMDAIHIHMPPDLNGLLGVFYRILGKKFVMDHHDLSPELFQAQGRRNRVLYRLLLMFERISCRWAHRLISTNETQRKTQMGRGGAHADTCTVVRNGPADFFFRQQHVPVHVGQMSQRLVIGFVGEMGEQDGVECLIRALHHLRTNRGRSDFMGLLVGSGRSLESLKKLANELCLQDHVVFTGLVPFHDVPRYIATFDIGATPDPSNPYNDSCTTIKTMEYMALGKPVVAFDTAENRITAEDAAIYVVNNDVAGYADALVRLMNDAELRARMGTAGRRRIEDELAWKYQRDRLLAVYESL
ncbi:MAG: glycosyltransferase family 4 protein [Pirellulaceae bacterium]